MVVRRTIAHLKTRPHHERQRIAAGIAIGVMVILFIGWGIYILHLMFAGATRPTINSDFQSAFSSEAVQKAGEQLQQAYKNVSNPASTPSNTIDTDVREIKLSQ